MKKWIIGITAAVAISGAVGMIAQAWAACPPGTSYQCTQGYNGKVICGCH